MSLTYREIFFAHNGMGPFDCVFCGEAADPTIPWSRKALVVHHQDENPQNNEVQNLVAAHHGCHVSAHLKGKPSRTKGMKMPPLSQEQINARARRTGTPEARALISISQKKSWTAERRKRHSAMMRKRYEDPAFRLSASVSAKKGWKTRCNEVTNHG